MKRILLLLFILCLSMKISWSIGDNHQFIPIYILDNTNIEERPNRVPAFVPIQAYYDIQFSAVCLSFTECLGDITITVMNLSKGNIYEAYFDSKQFFCMIPISNEIGIYNIQIQLSNGVIYQGDFEIE